MNSKLFFGISVLFVVFALSSCKKDKVEIDFNYYGEEDYEMMRQHLEIPSYPINYNFEFPAYFNVTNRPFNRDMATLGRVLFYDPNLSSTRTVSCGSCHKQELAFADDLAFSKGVNGHETARNSLALGSVFNFNQYYGTNGSPGAVPFFWDNSAPDVQTQTRQTMGNPVEMDMNMETAITRVEEQEYYTPLLKAAFGNADVTEDKILDAIGIFIGSLGSANTKFDRALTEYERINNTITGLDYASLPGLTEQENLGMNIFVQNCGSCHGNTSGMPGQIAANNGLDMVYADQGEGEGDFKVPTLRNIGVTGPYMHDGRFETLSQVIDHYSTGIVDHPNLHSDLKSNGQPVQMNFSAEEKAALIAFLDDALLDEEFLHLSKYSDPFIQ